MPIIQRAGRTSMTRGPPAIFVPAHLLESSSHTNTVRRSTEMNTGTTLVIGGNGKTGRRVVERLRARHLPVRVGSRSGTPSFDWEQPQTWANALRDVSAVYLTYAP